MQRLVLVCVAGAVGTGLRYLVGLGCARALGGEFPYGTLVVNVAGCFLMAAVMQAASDAALVPETARVALTSGFMGGLTTYSAFNFESTRLSDQRAWSLFALNVLATLALCFVAGHLGAWIARRMIAPAA